MGCATEPVSDGSADGLADLELTGRVVDAADLLSDGVEATLSGKLEQLEETTGAQLVVATTPDLKGYSIADYSLTLAREWGIGSSERNDGVLMLVAPNERQVRIEVGYGLEASIKDEEAALIIQETIVPAFSSENYDLGVVAGVEKLIEEITPYELREAA